MIPPGEGSAGNDCGAISGGGKGLSEAPSVNHRRQFCSRCNHMMFEYYASPDGHFGLVSLSGSKAVEGLMSRREVQCLKCGARYRLLDRLDATGQAANRV